MTVVAPHTAYHDQLRSQELTKRDNREVIQVNGTDLEKFDGHGLLESSSSTSSPTTISTAITKKSYPSAAQVVESGVDKIRRDFITGFKSTLEKLLNSRSNDVSCLNGGIPNNGKCACPKWFTGASCEQKHCLYGGELAKPKGMPAVALCKCPFPLHMEGDHCERITCANGGRLSKFPENNTFSCECSRIYDRGRFCEEFATTYAFLAIPIAFLLLFLVCCAVCKIDWCPRRGSTSARRRRSDERRGRMSRPRTRQQRPQQPHPYQPDLLNRRNEVMHPLYPPSGPPYVIRLDTIPTFNPSMIGGVESAANQAGKLMEPPPSYEQALTAPIVQPPGYSEADNIVENSKKAEGTMSMHNMKLVVFDN